MTAADSTMPRSIDDYLAQLRRALEGADPAMVQDALSDAEEHLRAECAARPGESEESVLRAIAGSYGSPEDVAAAYRETERTVQAALSPTRRPATGAASVADATATQPGPIRRFFSAWSDTRSWTSLVFMLVTLVTGTFYFTVVVTGMAAATEPMGIPVHLLELGGMQKTIRGALFGMCNPPADILRQIDLYRAGRLKLDEMITRRYRLDDIDVAVDDLLEGRNIRGVVVHDT